MKIDFYKVNRKYKKIIEKIYDYALKSTNNDINGINISVSFKNENQIKAINKEFRNIDKSTDVLSFPMLDIKYPQKLKDFTEEILPDGSLYLGDVVICPKIAKIQAKNLGHSLNREICFLALHGLLHVIGYDHIEKEDEEIMTKTSEEILQNLNIKRGE